MNLNEVLSIRAQESARYPPRRNGRHDLNEVLSIRAQEFDVQSHGHAVRATSMKS